MNYLIAFIYGAALFYVAKFFPFTAIFLSLLLLLLIPFLRYKQRGFLFALLYALCTAIVAVSGFFYAKLSYVPPPSLSDIAGKTIELEGILVSEALLLNPEKGIYLQTVEAWKSADENGNPLSLRELRVIGSDSLRHDKAYHIKVQIPKDAYHLNPGSREIFSGYIIHSVEIGASGAGLFEKARVKLNGFIRGNFSHNSSAFLMSIITGERTLLTKDARDAFSATGLAHILSISGAHFGLLLFILFRIFKFLVRALPYNLLVRLTVYLTPSQIAALLSMPFMIGYLGISSMTTPSIRAFIMITFFLFGLLIQRKGFWLNTLLLAAVIILLIQPDSLLDLSFQLSFAAVFCIGIAAGHIKEQRTEKEMDTIDDNKTSPIHRFALSPIYRFIIHFIIHPAIISFAATLGSALLVAYHFHYLSLISPAANLIITPFIGFVILPLALISSFIFLGFGFFPLPQLIDSLCSFVLSAIMHIAQWSFVEIKIPAFPPVLLVMYYLGILLFLIFNLMAIKDLKSPHPPFSNIKRYLVPVALPATISFVPLIIYTGFKLIQPEGLHITYLDVGQADSAVIELPDGKTIVSDTGKKGFQTGNFLKYRGIKKIDAVIVSHGHPDHSGGLRYLLKNYDVKEIWDNNRLIYPEDFFSELLVENKLIRKGLQRGDMMEGRGYRIVIFHPYDGFYTLRYRGEENNDSLVLKIQGRSNTFLFTGDIEKEAGDDISHIKEHLKSSVLKVPHHGSRTSISEPFLNAVSPAIAVISTGRKNPYNHPHAETIDALKDARIFRTDIDGAIGIREKPDGSLEVKTWRDLQIKEAANRGEEFLNLKRIFMVW